MSDTDRIDEFLDIWQEQWEAGEEPVVERLFEEMRLPEPLRPEVLRQIKILKEVDGLSVLPAALGAESSGPALPVVISSKFDRAQHLASGGLGIVSEAQDPQLQCRIAIKAVKFPKSKSAATRLRREALLTAALTHPGIVPVHGLGHDANGSPCYSMKLVEGETLTDAIRRFHRLPGAPDTGTAHTLKDPVAAFSSLSATRPPSFTAKNVIHRDLTPNNVMVGAVRRNTHH